MTNVEGSTSLVCFHDQPGGLEMRPADPDPGDHNVDYLRARERAERAAVKSAHSTKARSVHQELAQYYARKIHRSGKD